MKRAARIGDGFIFARFDATVREQIVRLRGYLADARRDAATFGLQAILEYGAGPETWRAQLDACCEAGVTHVAIRTINSDLPTPQAHIDALGEFAVFAGL